MRTPNHPASLSLAEAALCAVILWFPAIAWSQPAFTLKLASAAASPIDVDGNGVVDALTDGLLMMRYLSGVRGQNLIEGALGAGATRTTASQIEDFIATLVAAAPSDCTIDAVPPSSAAAPLIYPAEVQLTVNCASGIKPLSFVWSTGATAPSIAVTPAQTTLYTVTPGNSVGAGAQIGVSVYVAPPPPSICGIVQLPDTAATPVVPGATVHLIASCAAGGAVASCAWNSGIVSTGCSIDIAAPAADTAYVATPGNAGGAASPASTTVHVAAQNGGMNFCGGGAGSISIISWPATGQVRPQTNGFANGIVAFRITVPSTFNPPLNISHLGFVRIAEVPGTPVVARDFTVSKNACDFISGNYLMNGIGGGDTAPGTNFTANNPNGYFDAGASFNVNSGDVIYVNVRNANNGAPSCPAGSCDILFDFATPNRY